MHYIRCWWLEGREPCERLHKDVSASHLTTDSCLPFTPPAALPVVCDLSFIASQIQVHLITESFFLLPSQRFRSFKSSALHLCRYGCVLRPLCLIWMAAFVKVEEREWEIVKEKKWHGKIEKHIEDKSSALRSRDKNRNVIKICSLKEHGMRKVLLGSFVFPPDKMLKNQGSLLATLVPRRIFNINGIFYSTKGSSEY